MTIYPQTGTNTQFYITRPITLRLPQNLFHMLLTALPRTYATASALRNARTLLEELRQDIAALRTKADKVLLIRSTTNLLSTPLESPVERLELSKAQGMVHHLKHTRNSIGPDRLN